VRAQTSDEPPQLLVDLQACVVADHLPMSGDAGPAVQCCACYRAPLPGQRPAR
jgi:hypothetical protein